MSEIFVALDIANCLTTPAPALDMVLPGLLLGTVGSIVAPGATGKSWLALELAANVGAGVDLLGLGVQKEGRVVMFTAEDPVQVLHKRILELGEKITGAESSKFIKNVTICPTLGMRGNDFLIDGFAQRIIDQIENVGGARLIFIDTLSQFFGGEVNDRKDAARAMREFEFVAQTTGAALIFTNHVSKSSARDGQVSNQQSSKGSGVWVDEARWVAFLQTCTPDEAKKVLMCEENERKNYVRFGICKANYIQNCADIWLKRGVGGLLEPANPSLKKNNYSTVKNGGNDEFY